ncbi:zinc finger MYND domain-containing protein 12 isoform X2 [Meriones unguiculatus]|uniref:zinc finger MYND domain-containing protein 12 isoform X2 n=1 Tax=Meriones unguiculatus TaxID=10047 RepID=UPI00293EC024|nr:zinc finger MYND domain-containing protein 12 isoform X2 [Meriones unguiculatus]
MNLIYPLAVPKGRRLSCEVCDAPAERVCTACTVTYYCGTVHQKADWGSIHEKICQLLIPLRTAMPFYNSEEERQHGLQQLQKRQKHLIEFCYTVAQKYLFEGKHEEAVPAALHSLRFRMNVHGLNSVELVPAYLLLAEASLGAGIKDVRHRVWLVTSFTTDSRQIYFASCAFGTEDIRTSGGYFHLANIFHGLEKLELSDTLYTKASQIWHTYLNNHYQALSRARSQQADLLGKRFLNDTGLDEAQEAEAIRILTSILSIRESTFSKEPQKTILVLKTLSLLYFLMMDNSKAKDYAMRALGLAETYRSVEERRVIRNLLDLIYSDEEQEGHATT